VLPKPKSCKVWAKRSHLRASSTFLPNFSSKARSYEVSLSPFSIPFPFHDVRTNACASSLSLFPSLFLFPAPRTRDVLPFYSSLFFSPYVFARRSVPLQSVNDTQLQQPTRHTQYHRSHSALLQPPQCLCRRSPSAATAAVPPPDIFLCLLDTVEGFGGSSSTRASPS
jgi:hypothetical protein